MKVANMIKINNNINVLNKSIKMIDSNKILINKAYYYDYSHQKSFDFIIFWNENRKSNQYFIFICKIYIIKYNMILVPL